MRQDIIDQGNRLMTDGLLTALFVGPIVGIIVYALSDDNSARIGLCVIVALVVMLMITGVFHFYWRYVNGIDLFVPLESDPEVIKARMQFIMRYGHSKGLVGALDEFNTIFRNYPQWEFQKWEVFRAWYKHTIDHCLAEPEVCTLTMKADGSPYSYEKDPLYDPDAPDWYQIEREYRHYDDYDDDDDDDDDDDYDDDDDDDDSDDDSLTESEKEYCRRNRANYKGIKGGIKSGIKGGISSGMGGRSYW